jgi:glycine cleavage system H protein
MKSISTSAASADRTGTSTFDDPCPRVLQGNPRAMSNIPPDLKYAKTHEWVRTENNIATIGITDHAQRELTDVVFVELPPVGRELKAGDACAVVESVKTASDIYAPVSGRVIEVNPLLPADPALVNSAPYNDGWFFKLELANPSELDQLLDSTSYQAQIGT